MLRDADVLDYIVMDVAQSWERYCREEAEAKAKGKPPPRPDLTINKMQEMLDKVRR